MLELMKKKKFIYHEIFFFFFFFGAVGWKSYYSRLWSWAGWAQAWRASPPTIRPGARCDMALGPAIQPAGRSRYGDGRAVG